MNMTVENKSTYIVYVFLFYSYLSISSESVEC